MTAQLQFVASFTKSAVFGATSKTEFKPVFTSTDCARAGVAKCIRAKPEAGYFMLEPFPFG
jgi:hypothetical protein